MSEPGEGNSRIKVVDRRRFDESGDLRPDRPKPEKVSPKERVEPVSESAAVPSAAPVSDPPPVREPETQAREPETPEPATAQDAATSPLFMDLIAGLAQQAEILLTGAQGMPAQPAEAQRVIEVLSMLESKTNGNLSAEEKQVLSSVIFQLRTLFVQQNT